MEDAPICPLKVNILIKLQDKQYNNYTTILSILQSILTPEEVNSIVQVAEYEDKARKFTMYHLLEYWCMAAKLGYPYKCLINPKNFPS
ncbi:hypothetical protein GK047_10035 [Paenibacillus sp. SYP-B3998]|uniref:Uncharacterized protein n=1 Tax=Paenibacillus sp. SYP-B3998 TaxID=2678564 RepID=A0A6G3ZW44_9BACL|nr:hypothetical protein [Paenibacillus sp. SYP-B3998]NEW06352.1 hypothetical protein [Paenibacillus sp. SYP-B3998]